MLSDTARPRLVTRLSPARMLHAVTAASLCLLLAEQPLLAEAALRTPPKPGRKTQSAAEIQGEQRVLHALNRLTFGPRPGDLAAVEKMGLDRWFEQQLHPGTIEDRRLDARLADYPAMQLSIADLTARFPEPQKVRAYASGKLPLPAGGQARTVAADEVAFLRMRKEKEAAAKPVGAAPAVADSTQPAAMASATPASSDAQVPDPQAGPNFTRDDALRILAQSPETRLEAILSLSPGQMIRLRQVLRPAELARLPDGLPPGQRETLASLQGSIGMVSAELTDTRMLRDVLSDRQLEAVMTDFWLNHFNVYLHKNQQEPFLIPTYERETIRANALGNFEQLLVATAQSPAMLVYLDNAQSIGPGSPAAQRTRRAGDLRPNGKPAKAADGLNENYGRELMELHTLGVNGAGYTQADVTEVAKVFTGWTVSRPRPGNMGADEAGTFTFDARRHEGGSKTVLGHTVQQNGVNEGLEVLHLLATSPATAHFISEKLAIRFVADVPPPALVDRMAKSFLASGGDIKTVLRTMYHSPEFWSPEVYRAKIKTPEEFVLSAARASDARVERPAALVAALARLGQPFYGMQTPNGYAWTREDWVSTGALVSRMNFSLVLAGDRIPGTLTDWSHLVDGGPAAGILPAAYSLAPPADARSSAPPESAERKEARLEQLLLHAPVSDRTRATVLGQANDENVTAQAATQFDLRAPAGKNGRPRPAAQGDGTKPAPDDPQAAVMAGLLLGSPEFQRR